MIYYIDLYNNNNNEIYSLKSQIYILKSIQIADTNNKPSIYIHV